MKARIYQFPGNPKPVNVAPGQWPASIILLPKRVDHNSTCLELTPRRRRKRLPKVIIPINGEGVA